jgi:hypothetical protein
MDFQCFLIGAKKIFLRELTPKGNTSVQFGQDKAIKSMTLRDQKA